MENEKTWLQQSAQSHPRIAGAFVLLIGAGFLYFAVGEPVLHAEVGSLVQISGKGAIAGGVFAILGFVLMLFGSRALSSLQAGSAGSKAPVYIAVGIFGVLGIVSMEVLKSYREFKFEVQL